MSGLGSGIVGGMKDMTDRLKKNPTDLNIALRQNQLRKMKWKQLDWVAEDGFGLPLPAVFNMRN